MLYIVGYPTIEDVRAYAATGHEEAIASLADANEREEFLNRLAAEQPQVA